MACEKLLEIDDYLDQLQYVASDDSENSNTLHSSGAFEKNFRAFIENPQNVIAAYEEYDYFPARFFRDEVQHNLRTFVRKIPFSGKEQLSSIACGPLIYETFLSGFLFSEGTVFGIDISRSLMNYGSKKLGKAENLYLYEANAQDLPFPNESFDISFSYAALHWVPDLEKAVREMERVTKKNGFIHVTYNPHFAGMEIPLRKLILPREIIHDSSFTFVHPGFEEKKTFREIIYRL